jgi:hypothetical protein
LRHYWVTGEEESMTDRELAEFADRILDRERRGERWEAEFTIEYGALTAA